MHQTTVLIVDDDPHVNELIQDGLQPEGWKTLSVFTGEEAFQLVDEDSPDLIVLDIGLPGINGIETCRHIARISSIPIIMLSGRTDLTDKVASLNAGADDYLTKPFLVDELIAHAKAVLRRYNGKPVSVLNPFVNDYLEIDFSAKEVKVEGKEVVLTHTEYRLLEELALNAGRTLTYQYLLRKIWGPEYSEADKGCLQVHISHLRTKIEPEPGSPRCIISLPGIGYRFVDFQTA